MSIRNERQNVRLHNPKHSVISISVSAIRLCISDIDYGPTNLCLYNRTLRICINLIYDFQVCDPFRQQGYTYTEIIEMI